MKAIHVLTIVMVSAFLSACDGSDKPPMPTPAKVSPTDYSKCRTIEPGERKICDPSVLELITRPEWYEGASVVVAGVLGADHESFALFASPEDDQLFLTRKALALIPRQGMQLQYEGLNRRWVWVHGRFLPRQQEGPLRWGGTIADVTEITYLGSPRDPQPPPRPLGR
jgi:hypothetical protein